jgi:serine phosphatase RsbU (regulator of sigma subunit)
VTAVLVDIQHDGRFHIVSCGHPAPLLLTAEGRIEEIELDSSPPLSLGVDPVTVRGKLDPGDRLLLFTDGMIEARSPTGEFIDPARFLPALARAEFSSALDALLASLTRAAGHRLDDDIALLLACYDPDRDRTSRPVLGGR